VKAYPLVAVAWVCFLVACEPGTPPAGPRPTDADVPDAVDAPTAGITYRSHVARILGEHCVRCHVPGGIGPFPLDTYAAAMPLAPAISGVAEARLMPPYYADNSGSCNTYRDANWLTDEELGLLRVWSMTGAQEGDTSIPLPTPFEPPTLARVDATIDVGFDYTPTGDDGPTDVDELRCFLVDTGLATDRIITGYQVRPGEPRIVHHVIVYEPNGDPTAAAATLEAEDATPGWRCDGGARLPAHPVVLWAPGVGATRFPDTTGLRLVAGRPVVVQIHYNLATLRDVPDRTRVDLQLEDTVALEARLLPLADVDLMLAPRMARVETRGMLTTPLPGAIWGVFPHMHQRGREMRVEAIDGATNTCLLQTVRWDFHWQQAYWLSAPVIVRAGTQGTIMCAYDTRADTTTITWGEGTGDEMCLAYLYVTARP
jgi:hypothetical protein